MGGHLIQHMVQNGKSPEDIRPWLHRVPPELEDVYEYVFNKVVEPDEHAQSFLLFQWVCLAEQPLTIIEMRYAMYGGLLEQKDRNPS
ncbi:hypothetical protein BDV06DRAFT_205204, partial [Aspergillus oleicola]